MNNHYSSTNTTLANWRSHQKSCWTTLYIYNNTFLIWFLPCSKFSAVQGRRNLGILLERCIWGILLLILNIPDGARLIQPLIRFPVGCRGLSPLIVPTTKRSRKLFVLWLGNEHILTFISSNVSSSVLFVVSRTTLGNCFEKPTTTKESVSLTRESEKDVGRKSRSHHRLLKCWPSLNVCSH